MTEEMTGERSQLAALPLHEKVRLLSGTDTWHTHGCAALGLRPMITSDGPAGVRGTALDETDPSTSLPCPAALGATWDPGLVSELAAALGAEARSKDVDILLAPTINLMRSPLAGRGFECFSEDPELTARIAVAYVRGLQSAGVAATVKHYVGNDSETERWSYDACIAEPVLRELYLAPFEACVKEAGVAVVMAAYNSVNGSRMTEHTRLLRDVLKREWGFTGLVVSDWGAARSTAEAALGGLDLVMPGPSRYWGDALVAAVEAGEVPGDIVDDKVLRLLEVARLIGAVAPAPVPAAVGNGAAPSTGTAGGTEAALSTAAAGGTGAAQSTAAAGGTEAALGTGDGAPGSLTGDGDGQRRLVPVGPALLRRTVAASTVLLRNEDAVLPLSAQALGKVAVIGPNAIRPVIQGGGSARVIPAAQVATPAGAITQALAGQATVAAVPGCRTWRTVPEPPAGSVRDPDTGEPGIRLEFRAEDGTLVASEHRDAASLVWWDGLPDGFGWGETGVITARTLFRPGADGAYLLGASGVGRLTLAVDGAIAADGVTPVPADPVETMTRPGEIRAEVPMAAAQDVLVEAGFYPAAVCEGPVALRLGITTAGDDDALIAEAVAAAGEADVAVVVVGSSDTSESEGFDRASLALPGRQDELVQRVAAACPRTVVVVNAGMPVLMPWAGDVAAVLQVWLPGQAMGEGLVDVLLGTAEPGGRLPVTMPYTEADCPVLHTTPRDGRLGYDEGLLIGYRGYDAAGTAPMFAFGHGLGYTSWDYEAVQASASLGPGTDLLVRVTVRNTGTRPGREVVQAYVTSPRPGPGRPLRVLGAFSGVEAAPGETAEVTLRVAVRHFAIFDEAAGGWAWPPGERIVEIGRSARDLRLSAPVRVG